MAEHRWMIMYISPVKINSPESRDPNDAHEQRRQILLSLWFRVRKLLTPERIDQPCDKIDFLSTSKRESAYVE